MRRSQLQNRALDHPVFAHGFFALGGEVLQRRGEVLAGRLVFGGLPGRRGFLPGSRRCESVRLMLLGGSRFRRTRFSHLRLVGLVKSGFSCRRFYFGCDGGGRFGVMGGGVVEQGYASLLKPRTSVRAGCGACLADCWSESFGCGGLTLASELGQSQLPDVLQKPASKGNSSTIATPRKQCQTQKEHVTGVLQATGRATRGDGRFGRPASEARRSWFVHFAPSPPSATLP